VARRASLARAARLSILVIDDDRDVCEFLRDFLTLEGFQVTTLADPSLAIEWIRQEMFDLVMLDLMMPKIYGLDLLPQIRAVDDSLPVIIMCSVPSAETARESIQLGVSAYMSYPFLGAELRAALARVAQSTRLSPR
jgi:DNA-binding NtrC family response regulator